jgi:hypothetical protein
VFAVTNSDEKLQLIIRRNAQIYHQIGALRCQISSSVNPESLRIPFNVPIGKSRFTWVGITIIAETFSVLRYLVWFDRGHKSTKSLSGKRFN